jgi:hypothetical protein
VGMWLDHVDFGDYSLAAVQKELTGAELLDEDISFICRKLNITREDDTEMLKGAFLSTS